MNEWQILTTFQWVWNDRFRGDLWHNAPVAADRTTWRNGHRDRSLDTRLNTLNLNIPKLRMGAYFPGFLEPQKTVEKALVAVIQEAWIAGVSTRRVDELVQAMGMTGISKSSVSKLCKDVDERVHPFLKRLLDDLPPLVGEILHRGPTVRSNQASECEVAVTRAGPRLTATIELRLVPCAID